MISDRAIEGLKAQFLEKTKYLDLREEFRPIAYFPIGQKRPGSTATFVLRTAGPTGPDNEQREGGWGDEFDDVRRLRISGGASGDARSVQRARVYGGEAA